MRQTGHRYGRAAADTTAGLLATIIVVLAVLDLLIWATLWNVPNPVSKWVTPRTVAGRSLQPVRFASKDGKTQAAMLKGAAPGALPRSRVQ